MPNENYRRGWDETFGKRDDSSMREYEKRFVHMSEAERIRLINGQWHDAGLDEIDFAPRDKEERGND